MRDDHARDRLEREPELRRRIAEAIAAAGGRRIRASEPSGDAGSVYYRLRNGLRVRVSDHELPHRAERAWTRETSRRTAGFDVALVTSDGRLRSTDEVLRAIAAAVALDDARRDGR